MSLRHTLTVAFTSRDRLGRRPTTAQTREALTSLFDTGTLDVIEVQLDTEAGPTRTVSVRLPARLVDWVMDSGPYEAWRAGGAVVPLDVPLFTILRRTCRAPDGSALVDVDRVLKPSIAWWAHDLERGEAEENDRRANVRSARAVLRALEQVR